MKKQLFANNVNVGSLVGLLHTGAHTYMASTSKDKAIAMSIIIGAMLVKTHGLKN